MSLQLILWIDLREGIPADEVLAVVETTYVNEQKLKLMSSLHNVAGFFQELLHCPNEMTSMR